MYDKPKSPQEWASEEKVGHVGVHDWFVFNQCLRVFIFS